jgi:hypothetical protein
MAKTIPRSFFRDCFDRETDMIHRFKAVCSIAALGAFAMAAGTSPAAAQNGLYDAPYAFPQTNRASMAVVIKQAESGMFSSTTNSGSGTSSDGAPVFLCGGSGGGSSTSSSSSATANSSCIILNNSTGSISVGQDSHGSQTSNSDVDQVNQALQNNPATQP